MLASFPARLPLSIISLFSTTGEVNTEGTKLGGKERLHNFLLASFPASFPLSNYLTFFFEGSLGMRLGGKEHLILCRS